jgi:hypothetical protein
MDFVTLAELKRALHLGRRAADRAAAELAIDGGPPGLADAIDALPDMRLFWQLPPAYRQSIMRHVHSLVTAAFTRM